MKKSSNSTGRVFLVIACILIAIIIKTSSKSPGGFGSKLASVTGRSNIESVIKQALKSSDTYVLEVQSDFEFKSASSGSTTTEFDKGISSGTYLSDATGQGLIAAFIRGRTIRISANSVTMDEIDYMCTLTVLDGNDGIGIEIIRGDSMSVNQGHLVGVIKGNTLTASAEVMSNTVINGVGNGLGGIADFTVSIKKLDKDEWPPVPVQNVQIQRNDDNSILVSWQDPNPSGSINSYDIYRMSGAFADIEKVATVSNTSNWIDTSDVATSNDYIDSIMLAYYIVARSNNGKESPFSNTASFYGY